MDPRRTPVVITAGQSIERDEIVGAVEMARRASEEAFEGASGLRDRVQRVSMVSVVFTPVDARPASALSHALGLGEAAVEYTTAGGNMPQWRVTRAAQEIAEGKLDTTLLAGAEATRSLRAGNPNANFMAAARKEHQENDPQTSKPYKREV